MKNLILLFIGNNINVSPIFHREEMIATLCEIKSHISYSEVTAVYEINYALVFYLYFSALAGTGSISIICMYKHKSIITSGQVVLSATSQRLANQYWRTTEEIASPAWANSNNPNNK